ncbi:hypothetical protein DFH28DRAFT_347980 [Melampsora americana]|nr:hypothetical protein DFH28DRAFT_347980 [Melampsora americana]
MTDLSPPNENSTTPTLSTPTETDFNIIIDPDFNTIIDLTQLATSSPLHLTSLLTNSPPKPVSSSPNHHSFDNLLTSSMMNDVASPESASTQPLTLHSMLSYFQNPLPISALNSFSSSVTAANPIPISSKLHLIFKFIYVSESILFFLFIFSRPNKKMTRAEDIGLYHIGNLSNLPPKPLSPSNIRNHQSNASGASSVSSTTRHSRSGSMPSCLSNLTQSPLSLWKSVQLSERPQILRHLNMGCGYWIAPCEDLMDLLHLLKERFCRALILF